jgi:hypothetical protein
VVDVDRGDGHLARFCCASISPSHPLHPWKKRFMRHACAP